MTDLNAPAALACLKCGHAVATGRAVCLGCGQPVGWMSAAVEVGTVDRALRLRRCACCRQRPRLPGRFCTSCGEVTLCGRCGTHRREPNRFCRGCGLDIGALRFVPAPEGPVSSFELRSVKVEYDFKATPKALASDLERFGQMRQVDEGRLACALRLVDAIGQLAGVGEASLRVDFKGFRHIRTTPVPWFRGPPIALARHPWLEASASFFDHTKLTLILVTSVREGRFEVLHRGGLRRLPLQQVSDLLLFTLQLPEGRGLEPHHEEYMGRQLAAEEGRLRRVQARPDAATLEYDFGPLYLFKASRRDRVHQGYHLDRRLTPVAIERVIAASYKAILDATDDQAL